jgi:peptidyl-prolyl cis-trans isomerase D
VASSSVVVNAAYSLEVAEDGYASEVLDLGDDNYVVLRLNENFPSRQQSLDEVRDGLIDTLTNAIAQENIDAKIAEITAALDGGDSIQALSSAFALESKAVKQGARGNRDIDPEVNNYVFDMPMPRGEVVTDSMTTASGDFVAIQLTAVELADTKAMDKERLNVVRNIAERATSGKEFMSYQQALIEQADIVQ